jgi:hypothetical protein
VPLELQKKSWCQLEEECPPQTAFGIPIPKKLQTKLRSGFGIYKNRGFGFGFGIPQGSTLQLRWPTLLCVAIHAMRTVVYRAFAHTKFEQNRTENKRNRSINIPVVNQFILGLLNRRRLRTRS